MPADEDDLARFLSRCPTEVPVTVIGAGSNLLVRDGGLDGVVVRLGKEFAALAVDGETILAGAGVPDVKLASAAAGAGIAGLAFLRGIPGQLGGALRMNGGAYGSEIARVFAYARGVSRDGSIREYAPDDMDFTYRHCGVGGDVIFTSARLRGRAGDPEADPRRDGGHHRRARQDAAGEHPAPVARPSRTRPAPRPGSSSTAPAVAVWCTATRRSASCTPTSLVNRGNATAADIEALGETVRARVLETSGIELEWEIARMGRAA